MKDFFRKIVKIVKQNEEISKLKQETFNIFSILRKETEEEKLHSVFIAELLNPKGTHEFGKVFLELFVKKNNLSFEINDKIIVLTEKHTENGRIDIYIENDKKQIIAIENKIYASDQDKQLQRYKKEIGSDGTLLYLTLDGREASKESAGELKDKDYLAISYSDNIILWLESCMKEAADSPTVRETIKQYIILLKKLTGKLTNQKMEKELCKLIKENIETAKKIANNLPKVIETEVQDFIEKVAKEVNKKLGSEFDVFVENVKEKWSGIKIRYNKEEKGQIIKAEKFKANKELIISLGADSRMCKHQTSFGTIDFSKSNGWQEEEKIFNFGNNNDLKRLFNEKEELIVEVSDKLIKLTEDCKEPLSKINRIKQQPL